MARSSPAKPGILVLAQCLPYPPRSGVRSRTFHIVRELEREFAVTLLAFSRRNHQASAAERDEARRKLEQVVSRVGEPVPIPNETSRARRVWDHVRSVLTRRPYTRYEYQSTAFRRQVRDSVARARPALVHLDSVDLHGALGDLDQAPIACTHHDIEPQLLRLRAARSAAPVAQYLRHQAHLIERLIRDLCPRLDVNVMMSEIDAARLAELAPGAATLVAPNGVDADFFQPAPEARAQPGRIVFLGPTYQFANRDAVEYLLAEILPRVRARRADAALTLVGGQPTADRARFQSVPGVTCAGDVPDVRPYLAAAACSVVPIRVGGGTRLKILDAWAMGQAVVSTSLGCEGLDAVDGENILIRDSADAFAEAVVAVLGDDALRRRLGEGARATVERSYAWTRIGAHLRDAYRGIMR